MPIDITAYRLSFMASLASDLEIPFVPGVLAGNVQRPLGSLYVSRIAEVPSRVDEQTLTSLIRVFLPLTQVIDPEQPYDPTPLEAIAMALQESVRRNQTHLGTVDAPWFHRITAWEIDPVLQGVEASVLAFGYNAGLV